MVCSGVNIFSLFNVRTTALALYTVPLYILVKREIYVIKTVSPEVIQHSMELN